MKTLRVCALIILGFALSGCATIIKGTTQSISVATPPIVGASCELKNTEGTWYITTPGSVVVHKTKNDLVVTCTKDGFQNATVTIPARFNGVTAGNILLGGLVGIGVDAASGANYGYAEKTDIPMLPVDGETTPAALPPPEDENVEPVAS